MKYTPFQNKKVSFGFKPRGPTENRLVGEEGGVGFKETPPWFKTKRYFFVLKRCIFHVVSCKECFFFVYYCIYLCRFFSGSLFLEQLFFNATLKIAHSSEFRISEKRSKYIIEEEDASHDTSSSFFLIS